MITMNLHTEGKIRVERYYPDNGNSITLQIGASEGIEITIFGLPVSATRALLDAFSDALTCTIAPHETGVVVNIQDFMSENPN